MGTVKFMRNGRELRVGDKVTLQIKILPSNTFQSLYGWIVSMPSSSAKNAKFCVRVETAQRDNVALYPPLEDLSGVTAKEVVPENWPPQEHDVWRADSGSWHLFHCLKGDLVGGTRNGITTRTYTAREFDEFLRINPEAVLLFRQRFLKDHETQGLTRLC